MSFISKIFGRKPKVKPANPSPGRRSFSAADMGRLYGSWASSSGSADAEALPSLVTLRARSRDLVRNNPHGRRFIQLLKNNVVGENGVGLQVEAKNPGGKLDAFANDLIEEKWKAFQKKGNCTVDRQLSFQDVLNLVMTSIASDGEILVRMLPGWTNNDNNFALQLIEADQLDDKYYLSLPDGAMIRAGVEFNKWREPVAYHIFQRHPGDDLGFFPAAIRKRERIPADQILHLFMSERVGQTRGIPWLVNAAARLKMLDGYEEAELVAARVASAKMGFFYQEDAEGYEGDEVPTDDDDDFVMDAEPGVLTRLKAGEKFVGWDPEHPTSAFKDFEKAVLRSIAASFGVSYVSLGNDLEGVNYSSIRQGVLDERGFYMALQNFLIEHFITEIFETWLRISLANGVLTPLQLTKFNKYNRPVWHPKRWAWVDPAKDIKASIDAVKAGVTSPQRIAQEQGRDISEVITELSDFKKQAEAAGVPITAYEWPGKEGVKTNVEED